MFQLRIAPVSYTAVIRGIEMRLNTRFYPSTGTSLFVDFMPWTAPATLGVTGRPSGWSHPSLSALSHSRMPGRRVRRPLRDA